MMCEHCEAMKRNAADAIDGQLDAIEALLAFGAKEERLAFLEMRVRELRLDMRTITRVETTHPTAVVDFVAKMLETYPDLFGEVDHG